MVLPSLSALIITKKPIVYEQINNRLLYFFNIVIGYFMWLCKILCDLYTMVLVCCTERSNSSASGSKHTPSKMRLFNIWRSRSLKIHSLIICSHALLGKSNVSMVSPCDAFSVSSTSYSISHDTAGRSPSHTSLPTSPGRQASFPSSACS